MAPRPEHDGSDWSFRMVIEDRYKRLAVMRRTIKLSAIAQLVYICLRTLWHSVPFLAGEFPLTISTPYIFYAGAALFPLRAWAFGFGKANREKLWAIMLYSLASMLLTAECVLVFYMYHIDSKMMGRGAGWQHPHMLAKHNAGRLGVAPATVIVVGQWFERALDILGLAACAVNVYVTKEYVMEKKQQMKDAAAKKEGGGKKQD
ncbi:hypothetical protein C2E20_1244 [Micractinium conductrix]|uniref:Uncharacterized protein n=1 Tax=Micractinium conductrix TaxID=554055 RepID=A0A2P6VNV3_9CHLO|nr:hypothetical protein C2E20_1244 [Micractinium conductrix]|eukprot:PSC75778.1 hypothetical protein C2E20_1244 [Micractinium conductrix]